MPGPITYAAVTLLARDRLGQIRRALAARKEAGTAKELELHVLHLTAAAEAMMSASQPVIAPPVRLYGPPLTDHVSRFTLLGAIGPDLPRYAAYFQPGQRWLMDTLHKGTPDPHREKVLANTTNLIFDFWQRVGPLVDAEFSDQDKRKQAKQKMQAYVLGHLCHVAADVLSHPYFEAIEARLATPAPNAIRVMGRDDVAGAFDVRVASTFFGRGTDTRTKQWADWFPEPGEVPGAFAKALAASIQSLYGARAEGLPAFEEEFRKIDPAPPPLSVGLINESIDYFRTIIGIERVWTRGDWLGATAAMFLPLVLVPLGALVLPLGKNLTRPLTPADGPDAEARRRYESVVFPVAASALGPLVSMIIVSASGRGLRAEGVLGWVQAGLSLVASVGFFASLGGAGGLRWGLWFWLPLGLAVLQVLFVIKRGARENARKLLFLGPLVQVLLALFVILLYRGWLHELVEELQKSSDERDELAIARDWLIWIVIVAGLWFVHAVLWHKAFSASVPDDRNEFAGGEPRQFLRLYDDVALIHDARAPLDSERLADLVYPPARRPLLKLWWQAGTAPSVKVRIDHDRLVFHWDAPAGTPDQTVFAPLAPTTVERFGQLLATAVTGTGARGTLHVKPVRDDEKDLELAPGAVFSDHGDAKSTQADHDAEAALSKDIGTSEAAAFTLFHAPRPRLAERVGRSGVAADSRRAEQASRVGSLLQPVAGNPLTVRITVAGAVGTAQFTFQSGAGPVSAATATAPEVAVLALATTLVFTPGAFVAGDSWTVTLDGIVAAAAGNTSAGTLRATVTPRYRATNATDGTSPLLRRLLRPGDVLEIATAGPVGQQRIVEQVSSDTEVIVASAFTPPIAAGGIGYKRAAGDRGVRVRGTTPIRTPALAQGIGPNDVQGVVPGQLFGAQFMTGDVVELATVPPARRTVVTVKDAAPVGTPPAPLNLLELDAPPPTFVGAVFIDRLSDAEADGVPYVADASDVFGDGASIMNDAADLGALLCLGAASRLALDDGAVTPAGATRPLHRVYQVFRNWNLDRRRVNEWKLIVSGGAESERRGDFRAAEEAVVVDRADAGEVLGDASVERRRAADAIVREHGWLGVFRAWVDMASRARTDSQDTAVFRPGAPSNRDLSRAMAYLIDAADGVAP
jgi:zinc dependent phospholipase C